MDSEQNFDNSRNMLDKEEITSLLVKYGLPLEVEEKPIYITLKDGSQEDWGAKTLSHFHIGLLRMGIRIDTPDNTIIQVAKLALLMRSCMGGKIEIRCTISDPQKGEVKGTSKAIEIESNLFNIYFSKFLHTLISQYTNDIMYGAMGDYKKHYVFGDFGFMEDWTEDELKSIIEFEENDINRKLTQSAKLGRRLAFVLEKLDDYGLFEGMNQRKTYSFLYDWCVLNGIVNDIGEDFSGSLGKEKADWVKNRLNAFHKQIKKFGVTIEDDSGVF